MNNEDILEVVTKLNLEIYDQGFEGSHYEFMVKSNGYVVIIEFLGTQLWNTEDDNRFYYNGIDEYESLEKYLRRQVKILIERVKLIKL